MQTKSTELPRCKYCGRVAYKTNGRGENICFNRAYTGSCTGNHPRVRSTPKIGRNAACPCGSGKKYKKCCGGAA